MALLVLIAFCAAAGLGTAAAWWRFKPRVFTSNSVLRPQSPDSQALHDAERSVLSDDSIASIIERENLYRDLRRKSGMSEAVRKMRDEAISVREAESLGPVIILSFRYADAQQTQAAT